MFYKQKNNAGAAFPTVNVKQNQKENAPTPLCLSLFSDKYAKYG
jgi:hypothetical protein